MRDLLELSASIVMGNVDSDEVITNIKRVYETLKTMELQTIDQKKMGKFYTAGMVVEPVPEVVSEVTPEMMREAIQQFKKSDNKKEDVITQALTPEEAFQQTEIKCMICGTGGMKILKQHLNHVHQMSPIDYKRVFHIDKHVPLVSKDYHERRHLTAISIGFGKNKVLSPVNATLVTLGFNKKSDQNIIADNIANQKRLNKNAAHILRKQA